VQGGRKKGDGKVKETGSVKTRTGTENRDRKVWRKKKGSGERADKGGQSKTGRAKEK